MRALLDQAGCAGPVRMLDGSTRTAAEAAAALGVDVANIAKTLVFLADGAPGGGGRRRGLAGRHSTGCPVRSTARR